ncbi:unnamed protein product [Closterium sp. NIES-54]
MRSPPAATAPAEATAAVPPAPAAAALAPTLTPPPPDSPPPLIQKQTLARLNSPSASSSSSFYLPSSLSSLDLTQPLGLESPDSDLNQASGLARAGQVENPNLVRGLGSDSYRDIHVEHWLRGIKSSVGVDGEGEERRRLKDVADEKEAEVGEREMQRRRQAVLWSGVITALGINLHNFPECIAVFLGSMKVRRSGKVLLVHDVALPIYFGTRSRWAAFRAAALSWAAEPLGVIFVALFFLASLAPDIIEGLLAGGTCPTLSSPFLGSRWAAFRAAALSGAAEPLGVIFVALFFPASLAPDIIEGLLAGSTCSALSRCSFSSFCFLRWHVASAAPFTLHVLPVLACASLCVPLHPSPCLSIPMHPSAPLIIPLHPCACSGGHHGVPCATRDAASGL